jgi:hypothetical protein
MGADTGDAPRTLSNKGMGVGYPRALHVIRVRRQSWRTNEP